MTNPHLDKIKAEADLAQQDMDAASSALDSANSQISAQAAKITDLEKQVAELTKPTPPPTPTPTSSVIMGVNWDSSSTPEPNYFEGTWGGYRVYRLNQAKAAWDKATVKPKVIILSDDPAVPVSTPAAWGTALTTMMKDFNSNPERAKCRIVWVARNEIFNEYDVPPVGVIDGFKAAAAAAVAFPNCDVGVNATMYIINSGNAVVNWKPIAQYLDVATCSVYPPGRTKSPPVFTPYEDYIPKVLDCFATWGLKEFMIGETGIPVDKADQNTGVPTGPNDWTKRPNYMAGLNKFVYDGCIQRGMKFTCSCYWNQQLSLTNDTHPPNQFKHDKGKTTPDTASTWFNWKP